MIKSMTGYGRAEGEVAGRKLAVEVKAVNHRFLNFLAKLPPDLQRFEAQVQGIVKAHLQRGQVNVFALWDGARGNGAAVTVNLAAARQAAEELGRVVREVGLRDDLRLEHLLAVPAVLSPPTGELEPEELWTRCAPVFEAALADLDALRVREGADLERDMRGRLAEVARAVDRIEEIRPRVVDDYRARLARRVEELVQSVPAEVVSERLAMEVAIFADRSDVAEEVVRLRSHLEKYGELLAEGGVVGRKLDFLVQEMNRETNTIGAKGSDAEISRLVVEIKSAIEKLREQIQNVE
ncbi:MAG: YicC family protein [Deferrisomatales bacterium]